MNLFCSSRFVPRLRVLVLRRLLPASLASLSALILHPSLPAQEAGKEGAAPLPAATDIQPSEALGANDLIQILVPYCPEISRSFRISSDGMLALPLLKQPIAVAGLYPADVEHKIADALVAQQLLADPVVNVSGLEYP